MVAAQSLAMQENQDACHSKIRDTGNLKLRHNVKISLLVDLRSQCYTVRDPDLCKLGLGNLTGSVSALCQVADGAKEVLKKAGTANVQYYAFAYPTPNAAALLDDLSDPRQGFLAMGGFLYLDMQCNVVQVDSIQYERESDGAGQHMSLSDVEVLPAESVAKLFAQNRLQMIKPENSMGKTEYFAWLQPGEYLVAPSLAHGAFAYVWLSAVQNESVQEQRERPQGLSLSTSTVQTDEPQAVICRVICSNPRCCGEFRRGSGVPMGLSSSGTFSGSTSIPSPPHGPKPAFAPAKSVTPPARTPTTLPAATPPASSPRKQPHIPAPPATSGNGGRWGRPGSAGERKSPTTPNSLQAASGGVTP